MNKKSEKFNKNYGVNNKFEKSEGEKTDNTKREFRKNDFSKHKSSYGLTNKYEKGEEERTDNTIREYRKNDFSKNKSSFGLTNKYEKSEGEKTYNTKREYRKNDFSKNKSSFGLTNKYEKSEGEKTDNTKREYRKNDFSKHKSSFGLKNKYEKSEGEKTDNTKREYRKNDFSKHKSSFGLTNKYEKSEGEKTDNTKREYRKNDFSKNKSSFGLKNKYEKSEGEKTDNTKREYRKNDFSKNKSSYGLTNKYEKSEGEKTDNTKREYRKNDFSKNKSSYGLTNKYEKSEGEKTDNTKREFRKNDFRTNKSSYGLTNKYEKSEHKKHTLNSFNIHENNLNLEHKKLKRDDSDYIINEEKDIKIKIKRDWYKEYNEEEIKEELNSRKISYKPKSIDENGKFKNQDIMPLNKFLAHCGICSRRDAVELIKKGQVEINKKIILEPGFKINLKEDKVYYNKEIIQIKKEFIYILLNKPKDYITTSEDPQERKTVLELVKYATNERIYPIGRLDRNTTGVLLLTNDGSLTQKLTHPKYEIKKIYHVTLDKDITKKDLEKILNGVELEDGIVFVDEISFVEDGIKNQLGIEIHSGKNRVIRRIFETLGYDVVTLDRVLFAGLTKKNVPRGKWRFLLEKEIVALKYLNQSKVKKIINNI